MTSDYKKYSLDKLEEWMHDSMSAAEATPQEIYDVIKGVVEENYYYHKNQTSQAYELLALLNGNGNGHLTCDKDDQSPECKGAWNNFWEENYYPEEYKGSTVSSLGDDCMPPWGYSDLEYLSKNKEDKVKRWVLPVQQECAIDNDGEYFVNFPDDLLAAANLKEGDQIEWVDQGNGSFLLKKSWSDPYQDEMLAAGYEKVDGVWTLKKVQTYDEMIAAGYTMTDDGFWIKE